MVAMQTDSDTGVEMEGHPGSTSQHFTYIISFNASCKPRTM